MRKKQVVKKNAPVCTYISLEENSSSLPIHAIETSVGGLKTYTHTCEKKKKINKTIVLKFPVLTELWNYWYSIVIVFLYSSLCIIYYLKHFPAPNLPTRASSILFKNHMRIKKIHTLLIMHHKNVVNYLSLFVYRVAGPWTFVTHYLWKYWLFIQIDFFSFAEKLTVYWFWLGATTWKIL